MRAAAVVPTDRQLCEEYIANCASLRIKANSGVLSLLHRVDAGDGGEGAAPPTTLDLSTTFLGRRGVLPLLAVIERLPGVTAIVLRNVGATDFACTALCRCLAAHPACSALDLRGNVITLDALPALQRLAMAWCARDGRCAFHIAIDVGFGIFSASVKQLHTYRPPVVAAAEAPPDETGCEIAAAAPCRAPKHSPSFAAAHRRTARRLEQALASLQWSDRAREAHVTSDGWLLLGVYASTPFQGFSSEIFALHREVVPRVNRRLRSLKIRLVLVDLHTRDIFADSEVDRAQQSSAAQLPLRRQGIAQREAAEAAVLFGEQGSKVAEVRERFIFGACDIFLGLYDAGIVRPEQEVDLMALERVRAKHGPIPALAFHRKTVAAPPSHAALFDRHAHIASALLSEAPQEVDRRRDALLAGHQGLCAMVEGLVPPSFTFQHHAPFRGIDRRGNVWHDLGPRGAQQFVDDAVAALFAIGCSFSGQRNCGPCAPLAAQALQLRGPAPFPMAAATDSDNDDEVGAADDPAADKRAPCPTSPQRVVCPSVVREVLLSSEAVVCIFGPGGSGRTSQLRLVRHALATEAIPAPRVVTHSAVYQAAPGLTVAFAAIAEQLRVRAPMLGVPRPLHVAEHPGAALHHAVEAFAQCLEQARLSRPLYVLVDDADLVGAEAGEAASPQLAELLCNAALLERLRVACGCLRFVVTMRGPLVGAPHGVARNVAVPELSVHEAAALFVHRAPRFAGLAARRQLQRAAQLIVMQKHHGRLPLYLVLAAREMRFMNEETSMVAIAEVLPPTVEALVRTVASLGLPRELEPPLEAIATAPFPCNGALLAHHTLPPAAPSWRSAASWGRFDTPHPAAAPSLVFLFANFGHLFVETLGAPVGDASLFRSEWGLSGATVRGALWVLFRGSAGMNSADADVAAVTNPPRGAAAEELSECRLTAWQRALMRLSFARAAPFVSVGLQWYPTPAILEAGPFGVVELLASGKFLALQQLLRRLAHIAPSSKIVREYCEVVTRLWRPLVRHRLTLYACPHLCAAPVAPAGRVLLPPQLPQQIESALEAAGSAHLALRGRVAIDALFDAHRACLPIPLGRDDVSAAHPGPQGDAEKAIAQRVRTQLFVKVGCASESVAVVHRSVVMPRHEVLPPLVSPNVHRSFGFIAVLPLATSAMTKAATSCGTIVHKPHRSAISCVEIGELVGGAVRIATAAYCDPEVVVLALVVGSADCEPQLVEVGRYAIRDPRPVITSIAICTAPHAATGPVRSDDANFCPALCFGRGTFVEATVAERFGADNMRNVRRRVECRGYSGLDSTAELCGFSPAGTKVFGIDSGARCVVWGAPDITTSDLPIAVTQLEATPSTAVLVDADQLLYVTERAVVLWNSATSTVTRIVDSPVRIPFGARYGVSFRPATIPPNSPGAECERHEACDHTDPTNSHHAVDKVVFYDERRRMLRVFERRSSLPPSVAAMADSGPSVAGEWGFEERLDRATLVADRSCDADVVGNPRPERFAWAMHPRLCVALDASEGMVKAFDLARQGQAPLFFAPDAVAEDEFRSGAFSGPPSRTFEQIIAAAVCCPHGDASAAPLVLCGDAHGTLFVLEYRDGALTYPRTSCTSVEMY